MKKSTLLTILIFAATVALNIVAIVYLPHYIIFLLGCWQLGGWMGSIAGKLASRIK
jgi:flagellar biosynthesis protein FliQ